MNKIYFSIILAILSVSILFSQEKTKSTNWVLQELNDCNDVKIENETYWNFSLLDSSTVLIKIQGSLITSKQHFELKQDSLKIGLERFLILKKSKNTIILQKTLKEKCKKFTFINEVSLLKKQQEQNFDHNGDTIYFANKLNGPKLKNESSYLKYFKISFPPDNFGKPTCKVKLQFIINKNGELISPRGNVDCAKKPKNKAIEIINKTKKKWEPMLINGKAVNSLVRINFIQNSFTVDRTESRFKKNKNRRLESVIQKTSF